MNDEITRKLERHREKLCRLRDKEKAKNDMRGYQNYCNQLAGFAEARGIVGK